MESLSAESGGERWGPSFQGPTEQQRRVPGPDAGSFGSCLVTVYPR